MNKRLVNITVLSALLIIGAAFPAAISTTYAESGNMYEEQEEEKGPKGGRLLRDGDFSIEITIYEKGVPPEFRVYAYEDDKVLDPSKVNLSIELHRLDGEIDRYAFKPDGDVLIGDSVVGEPHSFDVKVRAEYKGKTHRWEYESYEGRTEISEEAAREAGVQTEKAGPATIGKYARLTGRITLNRNSTAEVRSRFPGIVRSVNAMWGQRVKKGEVLARVENNKSLKTFNVVSPISGVVLARNTNVGDVAGDEPLFTVADLSEVWAEFHVFPSDLSDIRQGQTVLVYGLGSAKDEKTVSTEGAIKMLLPTADANSQTVLAIVPLDNSDGSWRPGMTVKGDVLIDEKKVPLAVKTSALQSFRDFTVVFAKVGDTYEVRILELGMSDGDMVEVLSGLKPGTEYVTENSFLIKADIEKSGAGHDH